ncbi:hypothetical protein BSKO_01307 [Bryopsis sp. KO-2023]|nr:hypothetical protein BSKO_01307 [Bryopsis sp. KO-2023]
MVKRGSERQITKEDFDEEEAPAQAGVFGKASEAQINRRRIVKVKRNPTNNTSGPNPFAGIALTTAQPQKETQAAMETEEKEAPAPAAAAAPNEVPPAATTTTTPEPQQDCAKLENAAGMHPMETPAATAAPQTATEASAPTLIGTPAATAAPQTTTVTTSAAATPTTTVRESSIGSGFAAFAHSASPFKQLVSGTPAFGGAGGFGSVATNGHQTSAFGGEVNWATPGQRTILSGGTKQVSPGSTPVSSPKVTGEEEEETLFNHEATLYVMVGNQWKQRGKGDLRVNSKESGGRLIMRQKVTLRLFLNAGIFEGIKVTKTGQNAVTFSCVNGADESLTSKEGETKEDEGDAATDKGSLKVYALRFLVKGEGAEMLVDRFEKAVEQCRMKASKKSNGE